MSEKSILEQLKSMTTIVADTGDLEEIQRLRPTDATTNPSLITKALLSENRQADIRNALARNDKNIEKTIDDLTLRIGKQILESIDGRVSTEVDARLANDKLKTIDKAKEYIDNYTKLGVDTSRVLIKIPATWAGIQAAQELEKQNIHCNLTLLFDMHQAKACADAGVNLISPFVGRILDWQKAKFNLFNVDINEDLGVQSVKNIYHYYKQHTYKTQIMAASFRNTEEIIALAGCDLLTIAPNFLDDLANTKGILERQLSENIQFIKFEREILGEASFKRQEQNSQLTRDLLPKGIQGFIQARADLAQQLSKML